jgi:hypothetical protein
MKNSGLDALFEGKSKKDILYLYASVVLAIGFIIFYFIYPMSASFKEKEEKKYKENTQKLSQLKSQKNVFNAQIIMLTKQIKQISLQKNSLQKQKVFFDDLLNLLDFIEFDKYKWADYFKHIVDGAKEEGLDLIDFTNKIYNNDKNIVNKKMDIIIHTKGNYKNLISYIYRYENTKELIRVDELNITDKGDFMIKFVLYGYKQ